MDRIAVISGEIAIVGAAGAVIARFVFWPLWKLVLGLYQFVEGVPPKYNGAGELTRAGRPGVKAWQDGVDRHLGNGSSPPMCKRVGEIEVRSISCDMRLKKIEGRRKKNVPVLVERRTA